MFGKRNRTSLLYIESSLYLYFLGLSIRGVSKAMFYLHKVKRSHVFLAKKCKWIQKYKPQKASSIKRKRISDHSGRDITQSRLSELIWLWGCNQIEPENRQILALF